MTKVTYRCDKCGCFASASDRSFEGKSCKSCSVGTLRIIADEPETDRPKLEEGSNLIAPPSSIEVASAFADAEKRLAEVPVVEMAEVSWQLMECDQCDYSERMSLAIESITCPKNCKGTMRPADAGKGRELAGYTSPLSREIVNAVLEWDRLNIFADDITPGVKATMITAIEKLIREHRKRVEPKVVRGALPDSEAVIMFCDDAPFRPDNTPVPGDVNNKLIFPLCDGRQLELHCGKETFAHFVAILAAAAVDDAEEHF